MYKHQSLYFSTTQQHPSKDESFHEAHEEKEADEQTTDSTDKQRSFGRTFTFFFTAPLVFFFIAFGGGFISIARQGFGYGKIPEQYQYFRRYIAANPTLMDELGVPLKIIGGTTKIDVRTEHELKFRFEIQGEFGGGIVFCERMIECVEPTADAEETFTKRTVLHIHVDTTTDLGQNHFEIVNAASLS